MSDTEQRVINIIKAEIEGWNKLSKKCEEHKHTGKTVAEIKYSGLNCKTCREDQVIIGVLNEIIDRIKSREESS